MAAGPPMCWEPTVTRFLIGGEGWYSAKALNNWPPEAITTVKSFCTTMQKLGLSRILTLREANCVEALGQVRVALDLSRSGGYLFVSASKKGGSSVKVVRHKFQLVVASGGPLKRVQENIEGKRTGQQLQCRPCESNEQRHCMSM